jgi:hypothetical protein
MRGSDLLSLLRLLFICRGAELILRPGRLKIGKAEMICNKGRIGQIRLAILSGLVGWPSRQLLVRCAKYGPCQGQGQGTNYKS